MPALPDAAELPDEPAERGVVADHPSAPDEAATRTDVAAGEATLPGHPPPVSRRALPGD
jgi:hypothetical protein